MASNKSSWFNRFVESFKYSRFSRFGWSIVLTDVMICILSKTICHKRNQDFNTLKPSFIFGFRLILNINILTYRKNCAHTCIVYDSTVMHTFWFQCDFYSWLIDMLSFYYYATLTHVTPISYSLRGCLVLRRKKKIIFINFQA